MSSPVTNSINKVVLIIVTIFVSMGMSFRSTGTVEVVADTKASLPASPGEIVSTVFEVRNTSDSTNTYRPEVELPPGWLLVSSRSEFAVPGQKSSRRVVSFRVPAGSDSGRYTVGYAVSDATGPDGRAQDYVSVVIGQVQKLDLQVMDVPGFVLAGDSYKMDFLLINAGNIRFQGLVRVRNAPDFPVTLSVERVDVPANTSVPISVNVETESLGAYRFQHWVKLEIVDLGGEAVATGDATIDVLPTGPMREQLGSIPASVRLTGFESYRGRGTQLQFAARGAVREETDNIIDLFVRTPDYSTSSLFARRDEYRAALITEYFAVKAGDQIYGLSPLTERGRYGRGLGLEGFSGPMSLGVFASRNRNAFPREDVLGVSLGYALSERVDLTANFVDKTGQFDGQTISIRTRFEPVRNSLFDVEIGDGGSANQRSAGISAQAQGRYDLFSYDVRHLSAGKGFPGLYQNYANTSGSAQVRPLDGLTLSAAYQYDDRAFAVNAGESAKTITKYLQAGPSYDFKFGANAITTSVKYAHRAMNTVVDRFWTTRNEHQARIRADMRIPSISFGVLADIGRVNSSLLDASISGARYGVHFRTTGSRLKSSVYFERTVGATINRVANTRSASMGATVVYDINSRTELGLNAFMIRDNSNYGARYSLLATRLRHRFAFGHLAGVETNVSSFGRVGGRPLGDVAVYYEIPLGIPSLRPSSKRLTGKVIDFESGEPIPGALLRLGRNKVVTDADGNFAFRWESAGRQYLFLDQASIGLDKIPMIPMPLTVSDESLSDALEIPVARAGELFGVVRRYEYRDGAKQGGDLIPIGTEPYAVIEVSDGVGSFRTTTDDSGNYCFRNLRPGNWSIRIVFVDIPETYRVESKTRKYELKPGAQLEVELRTLPRRRNIKFVAGGRVTVGDSLVVRARSQNELPVGRSFDGTGNNQETESVDPVAADSTSPRGESVQVNGRNPSEDQFVANRIRRAFEEALRVASDLDSNYVWQERYIVVDTTGLAGCVRTPVTGHHVVQTGETLAAIARKYYCDPVMWPKVWLANYEAARDPHWIQSGQKLVVPEYSGAVYGFKPRGDVDRRSNASLRQSETPFTVTNIYTVRENDTLYGIAKRTMGNGFLWPRIWMTNRKLVGEDTELIRGMELLIPGPERLAEEDRVLFGIR